jgi:hypothetical protein
MSKTAQELIDAAVAGEDVVEAMSGRDKERFDSKAGKDTARLQEAGRNVSKMMKSIPRAVATSVLQHATTVSKSQRFASSKNLTESLRVLDDIYGELLEDGEALKDKYEKLLVELDAAVKKDAVNNRG